MSPSAVSMGRFRFRGWTSPAASQQPKIEIDVSGDTRAKAAFEVSEAGR